MHNYYDVLGCSQNDSVEKIRKSYQKLILEYHPDKQRKHEMDDFHILVDKAWKVLRDVEKRKIYDAELYNEKMNERLNIFAEIISKDLIKTNDSSSLYYPCRCGGSYVIDSQTDLENLFKNCEDLTIECDECSLVVLLKKEL